MVGLTETEAWAVRPADFFLRCVLIRAQTGMKGGVRTTLEAKLWESGRCVQGAGARANCTGRERMGEPSVRLTHDVRQLAKEKGERLKGVRLSAGARHWGLLYCTEGAEPS